MLAREPDLELNDNPAMQRRIWILERIGWAGFGLVIAAAFLGLLGAGGRFGRASASNVSATVDYPRVTRWQAADRIVIDLPPSAADRARVVFGPALVDAFAFDRIEPAASHTRITPAGHELEFDADRSGRTHVVVGVRPVAPRLPLRGSIRVDGGPELKIETVILP